MIGGVSGRNLESTVLGIKVSAQEKESATPSGDLAPEQTETSYPTQLQLNVPTLLPGNPLYLFKTTSENIRIALTFNRETKIIRRLRRAEERLAEVKALIDSGELEKGAAHLAKYQEQLNKATRDLTILKKKGVGVEELAGKVEEATAKHITVLEKVALQVPEQAAEAIENAIETSQTGMDRAADALGEPPVPVDLLARINALRGQGILTEEEAATLVQAGSREEARKVFKNLKEVGLIPEADFKKLDTAQANYYNQDFTKLMEIYKFKELKRFEQEEPDEEIKKKLREFAKTFRPGDIVPPELRRYWASTVRLEEIQKTIRPDLIDPELFVEREEDFNKLKELYDRVRPTTEEVRRAEQFRQQNPDRPLPPELQRVIDLKKKLGVVAEGSTPPPGHEKATFLPPEFFKFGEAPFTPEDRDDYQKVSQDESSPPNQIFHNSPEERPRGEPCPEGKRWNGSVCISPPPEGDEEHSSQETEEQFRTPYYPPKNQEPVEHHEQASDQYAPEPGPGEQTSPPPRTGSCPEGSSWNGSTCFFPPSEPEPMPSPEETNPSPN